jgi:hypothetical protein
MIDRISAFALFAILPCAAAAQVSPEPEPSTGDQARRIITQPLEDVNVRSRDIPPLLEAIGDDPYRTDGLTSCRRIAEAVAELDAVLGPDFDRPSDDRRRDRAANLGLAVAGEVLGGFIPFRGLVREVSGANAAQERRQTAFLAGAVRRAFLKGYARSRRCPPPAPATPPAS